jgi:DNA-directed RNA polymerase
MTDYNVDELLHEQRMSDDGADRYQSTVAQLQDRNQNGATVPGRALMRRHMPAVHQGVLAYLKAAKGGPGRHVLGAPLLKLIPPKVVAMISLVTVVDQIYGPRSATQWARTIGQALEDEYRCSVAKKADPAFWRDLQKRIAHLGHQRRRLWIMKRGKTHDVLPERWVPRNRAAAGAACLEIIEAVTPLIESRVLRTSPKKTMLMVYPTQELIDWLAEAHDHAAASSALYRPMLEPPVPWEGVHGGAYKTDLVLRRPAARFRGVGHQKLVERTNPEQFRVALDAMNKLQDVPWRINMDVLEVVEHLAETGGAPLSELVRLPMPTRPDAGDEAGEDIKETEWMDYRRAARDTHRRNEQRDGRRILVSQTCRAARAMADAPKFYMPHRMCFRGRSYPIPNWIQPQGPDVARGLLTFAQADPMTPEGWDALMDWGDELGALDAPTDTPGATRFNAWVRAVHADPLEHAGAWANTKDPFQALAWFLEVGAALEAGYPHRPFLTSLPCFVDASNNGLQLYSLLTGCRDLARFTNVLPGPKEDLYTHVGDRAWEKIQAHVRDPESWAHDWAMDWVRILPTDGIPRDCAKRPVMTMPYNVTRWSAADYVRDWYFDNYTSPEDPWGPLEHNQKAPRYLAKMLMEAVNEICPAAVAGMAWIGACADACTERGVPLRWTSPSGWPVQQEYRERRDERIQAHLGGSIRRLVLWKETGRADPERQKRASAPNYVHSVDAAVMARAIAPWEGPISARHDAFGTTAPRVAALGVQLRESVADVLVEKDQFAVTYDEVLAYSGLDPGRPPKFGEITREEVLASEHMFS